MYDRYRTFSDGKYSNSLLLLDHLTTKNTQTGILLNSEDQGGMPRGASLHQMMSHQGLHQ